MKTVQNCLADHTQKGFSMVPCQREVRMEGNPAGNSLGFSLVSNSRNEWHVDIESIYSNVNFK